MSLHLVTLADLSVPFGSVRALCGAYVSDRAEATSRVNVATCPACRVELGLAVPASASRGRVVWIAKHGRRNRVRVSSLIHLDGGSFCVIGDLVYASSAYHAQDSRGTFSAFVSADAIFDLV